MSQLWKTSALIAVVLLSVACGHKKHKPPVEPEPVVTAEPPPPPPPKCEALEENCEAKIDTKARIAKTKLVLTPAAGWKYAQGADITITQAADDGAVLAIAGYEGDPKDAKKNDASRDQAFEALAKAIGMTPPAKKKVNWKKPGETKDIFGKKVALFEVDGAERSSKKGPMLVVSGQIGDTLWLLGVGFVPDDDQNGAGAMMRAIDSLGDAPADDAGKSDNPDDKAAKPDDKAAKPDDKAAKPDDKAAKPDDKAAKPDDKAAKPDDKAAKPDDKAAKPGDKTQKADKAGSTGKKDEPAKGPVK